MTSLVSVAEVSARCAVAASRDADDVQLIIDANEQLMIGRLATAGVTEGNVSFFMRGYPASVFALLPEVLERAGRTASGSITGFYTVLVEGDDFSEPVADAVKGITDGQLWLCRSLANKGHFPAIDVLQSSSRLASDLVTDNDKQLMSAAVELLATYERNRQMK